MNWNYAALLAGIALVLSIFPQPLLWLDSAYTRAFARSIVKASEGNIDIDTASDRIRDAEAIEPGHSARLFAGIIYFAGCAIGTITSGSILKAVLVLLLAAFTVFLAARPERTPVTMLVTFVLGAASIAVFI